MVSCKAIFLLALHCLTFGAQLLALVLFWQTGNTYSFFICLATLLITGSFFSDAIWKGALWKPRGLNVLPINGMPLLPRFLCYGPLTAVCGFLQCVMFPLTLQHATTGDGLHGQAITNFHGKGVNGVFEGIVCSGVFLHAYIGIAFPEGSLHPITHDPPDAVYPLKFLGMSQILRVVGIISFASGGLGILHMDFNLCEGEDDYIRSGSNPYMRLFRHWLFRTSELVSRVSLHVIFFLFADEYLPTWRWFPGTMSILFSVVTLHVLGGSEASSLVVWVCGFLCTFVDIFCFLDSTDKRRAARKLSKVLTLRHLVELVYMPVLLMLLIGTFKPSDHPGLGAGLDQVREYLRCIWHIRPVVLVVAAAAFLLYLCLLCHICVQRFLDEDEGLFEACDALNDAVVREALGNRGVNVQDTEGRTPLVRALLFGLADEERCADICTILIESGAKIDERAPVERMFIRRWFRPVARFRWTPLHVAAHRGRGAEVWRALLNPYPADAPADFRDLAGNTPLHVAVNYGKVKAAQVLVGSFPGWMQVRNFKGKTPLDLASAPALQLALANPVLLPPAPAGAPAPASWPVEMHPVARLYLAPGLASYAVARGGGPAVGSVMRLAQDALVEDAPAAGHLKVEELWPIDKADSSRLKEWGADALAGATGCGFWWRSYLSWCTPPPDVATNVAKLHRMQEDCNGFCHRAVIGKGTYGVVWLARRVDRQDERYAVKTMDSSTPVATREQDLCKVVDVWPHPCLPKLYGIQNFEIHGLRAIIMEYIPGGDLRKAIKAGWDVPRTAYTKPPEWLQWLGQIFLALEHLHLEVKVLLRDLKPENVVLDDRRRAKLVDLGVGRIGTEATGNWATLHGGPPGTPGYCAPEVLSQVPYNEKADLYSFGVTAFMVLTGGRFGNPAPPMNSDHYNPNIKLLRASVNKAINNSTLTPVEGTFVDRLTAMHPSDRLDHSQIRGHPLFAHELQNACGALPEHRAGFDGAKTWLDRLPRF